jgi:hypothetical protein
MEFVCFFFIHWFVQTQTSQVSARKFAKCRLLLALGAMADITPAAVPAPEQDDLQQKLTDDLQQKYATRWPLPQLAVSLLASSSATAAAVLRQPNVSRSSLQQSNVSS